MTKPHTVWPEGPPCDEQCPGAWSQYHDGYAWGYEKAEAEVRARLAEEVKGLPLWSIPTGDYLDRDDVLDIIQPEGAKA